MHSFTIFYHSYCHYINIFALITLKIFYFYRLKNYLKILLIYHEFRIYYVKNEKKLFKT